MDVRLKELIDTIKTEGLKNAEESSAQIIRDAEKKAQDIIAQAKAEGAEIVSRAHRESDQRVQSGQEALRQAGRDLILSVEKQLVRIFTELNRESVKGAFSREVLENAIVTLVKKWEKSGEQGIQVLVPQADLDKIEKSLRSKLSDEFRKGLEVKASPNVKSGFHIGEKNGAVYYDFSSESIADSLAAYLNPRLSAIVREAAGKE